MAEAQRRKVGHAAFFGLGAVFATLAVFMVVCGLIVWRYLPRGM